MVCFAVKPLSVFSLLFSSSEWNHGPHLKLISTDQIIISGQLLFVKLRCDKWDLSVKAAARGAAWGGGLLLGEEAGGSVGGELPWSLGLATKLPEMRREASLTIPPEKGRASKNVCVAGRLVERQESSEAWEWAQNCKVRDVSPVDHLHHVQIVGAVELLIKPSPWNWFRVKFKAGAWAQLIPFSISSGSLASEGDQRKNVASCPIGFHWHPSPTETRYIALL